MDIIQVCPAFFPNHGGLETHVREISKRLAKSGIGVKIFTTDSTGNLPKKQIIDDLEVFRFKSFSPNRVYFFAPKLYSALRKIKDADIIHAHGYPNFPALATASAKAQNCKPFVFTPHYGGYDVQTLGTSIWQIVAKKCYNASIGKYIFSKVDETIIVAKFERGLLKQKFGLDNGRIIHIPNGISIRELDFESKRDQDIKTVLYVGRLERYKGVHFLIKAFAEVKPNFPDSRLVIVGSGSYKEKLIHLAHHFKLRDSVSFLENIHQEKLTRLYMSSNIFVTLSQFEGHPISLTEAMSSGLSVIATKVGGIPELIQHGKNGFLLDFPPSKKALVDLIMLLLEDANFSAKIGLRARKTILSTFSWRKTVLSLIELYEQFS